jgi:hypothetical protein
MGHLPSHCGQVEQAECELVEFLRVVRLKSHARITVHIPMK